MLDSNTLKTINESMDHSNNHSYSEDPLENSSKEQPVQIKPKSQPEMFNSSGNQESRIRRQRFTVKGKNDHLDGSALENEEKQAFMRSQQHQKKKKLKLETLSNVDNDALLANSKATTPNLKNQGQLDNASQGSRMQIPTPNNRKSKMMFGGNLFQKFKNFNNYQ